MKRPYLKWFVQFILASILVLVTFNYTPGGGNMGQIFMRFFAGGALASSVGVIIGDISLYKGQKFIISAIPITVIFGGLGVIVTFILSDLLQMFLSNSDITSFITFGFCSAVGTIVPMTGYNAMSRSMRKYWAYRKEEEVESSKG